LGFLSRSRAAGTAWAYWGSHFLLRHHHLVHHLPDLLGVEDRAHQGVVQNRLLEEVDVAG
jgi:hypothetical protein